jgi:hypothetical protein
LDDEFTVSLWANPRSFPNWVPLIQIGSSTDTFFLLQSNMQVSGPSGFGATFKAPGNPLQERLTLGAGNDLPIGQWTHVVFTMSGSTGKIYFDGELMGTRTDFTLGIADVGINGTTTANFIGSTSWPDGKWNGLIDDARIYAHELSAAEVRELFEGEDAPSLDVSVVAGNRCVAGRAMVTVQVSNDDSVPVSVDMVSAYGSRSFASVEPGKNAFHAFTTREASVPAGSVSVEISATVDGDEVTVSVDAGYDATSCS